MDHRPRSRWRSRIVIAACLMLSAPALNCSVSAQPANPPQRLVPGTPASARAAQSWLAGQPVGMGLASGPGDRPAIKTIEPGSAAARAGLRAGDVVERIGDQQVTSPDDTAEQIENAWAGGHSAIDLVVSRAGRDFYVALRLRS